MRILTTTLVAVSAVALTSAAAAAQPSKASRLSVQQGRVSALGDAEGVPQRDPAIPRGLASAFARGVPGTFRAIRATAGSNSRLQDLPASP